MMPKLILQFGHSADGFVGRPGERTTLTGREGWTRVYKERVEAGALMIGIGTALADNPMLSAHGHGKNPIRIIADTHGRLTAENQLVQTADKIPTWVLTARESLPDLAAHGVRVITCPLKGDHLDLHEALRRLELPTLICEGGPTLGRALHDEGLVDELVLIEATDVTLGDGMALPALPGYMPVSEEQLGADIWRVFRPGNR